MTEFGEPKNPIEIRIPASKVLRAALEENAPNFYNHVYIIGIRQDKEHPELIKFIAKMEDGRPVTLMAASPDELQRFQEEVIKLQENNSGY